MERALADGAKVDSRRPILMYPKRFPHSKAAQLYSEESGIGMTPLMLASQDGRLDLAQLLLERNANVNAREEDSDRASPEDRGRPEGNQHGGEEFRTFQWTVTVFLPKSNWFWSPGPGLLAVAPATL